MTQKETVIRVTDLVKNYGSFQAVKGISFSVMQGEIFGLLGPNGAGKTTTLEIIETLRSKTAGEVEVLGLNIDRHADELKKRIGVQLQAAGYYPGLKLDELLLLFGGLFNVEVDIQALLARVGLTEKRKAYYKQLSGGQKQRFSLATTLINTPEVIFMDEPTTGLDPQARRNIWNLIKEIREEGCSIILTTHYMEEAEQLCDRVAIIDHGKIIACNRPSVLIDDLLQSGFKKEAFIKPANLEDVFLQLTGEQWRDN
ncbi:MAG TPA: ABC transporter ATP-binding protein [Bacteroidia bacterium]|nr:ABC transporter ATP-binding protein [Bacteroidia bacterium]HNT80960.1 ABC transporter ATP-binding protein [Bacteroidia bacterium]